MATRLELQLQPGDLLKNSEYEVFDLGHKGGTSHVYTVRRRTNRKIYALKVIDKAGTDNISADAMKYSIKKETEILVKLDHPNIAKIEDYWGDDKYFYIVEEYIAGKSLEEISNNEGPQSQENVIEWGKTICRTFDYLHNFDPPLIYRDLKPANIMLESDTGRLVLIDFGGTREYDDRKNGDTVGIFTEGYAAPEQYDKKIQTDARSDIHTIGVTMFRMLTGVSPRSYAYKDTRLSQFGVSSGLEYIINKAREYEREKRYPSAKAMLYDLEHYQELTTDAQKRKKTLFGLLMGSIALCMLSLILGVVFRVNGNKALSSNYESLIRAAQISTTKDGQVATYMDAIASVPTNLQAYDELIDIYLEDGTFSKEEADNLIYIMGSIDNSDGKRSNEALLKENTNNYDTLCYKVGIAYFYYYEGTGNKTMARTWLETAAQSTFLSEEKRTRAERLVAICSYYTELFIQNRAGDTNVSYADYWEDIEGLSEGDIVHEDNAKTACVMYQDVVSVIANRAINFKRSGVEAESLIDKLDDIENRLQNDFSDSEKEDNESLITTIIEGIERAREAIDRAYNGREG